MTRIENLWAPWRLEYVSTTKDADSNCALCDKQDVEIPNDLLVAKGKHTYVVMNLYPYNNGHLMVVPYRHVADIDDLTEAESAECQDLIRTAIRSSRAALGCDGFNVGLNLGHAAGAGIAAHLHWHVVPRWHGDTNFMPVLSDVRVMPQHLKATQTMICQEWKDAK